MIHITYKLIQTGSGREYVSTIEHEKIQLNHSIFHVLGENGKGKSFLLNLLAFALKAHECPTNSIDELIKSKISALSDVSKYDLEYTIEFTIPNTTSKIKCIKEFGKESKTLRINNNSETILGPIEVNKIIEVIYDVPNNIEGRLKGVQKDLIESIVDFQKIFTKKISDFSLLCHQVNDVRNEEFISTKKVEIDKLQERINIHNEELTLNKEKMSTMIAYKAIEDLMHLFRREEMANVDIQRLKKKLRGVKKPVVTSPNHNAVNKYRKEQNDIKTHYKHHLDKLVKIISNEDYALFIDDLVSSYSEDYHNIVYFTKEHNPPVLYSDFHDSFQRLGLKIPQIADRYLDNNKLIFIDKIEALIDLLESTKQETLEQLSDVIGNIPTLIDKLKTLKTENYVIDYSKVANDLKHILDDLNKQAKDYDKLEKLIAKESKVKTLSENDRQTLQEFDKLKAQEETIRSLPQLIAQKKLEIKEGTITFEDRFLDSLNSVSSLLESMRSNPIIQYYKDMSNFGIDNLKRERQAKDESISNLYAKIRHCEAFIENEMQKPQSVLSEGSINSLQKLEKLMIEINSSLTKISNFVSNDDSSILSVSENQNDIESFIGEMIVETLNYVLPLDDRTIELELYNYRENYFLSKTGERIYLDYVSTGLSSASYLMHKIRNSKGHHNLILLDEVGNMSERTRQKVIKEVERLEDDGRLINMLMARVENGVNLQIIPN